MAVRTLAVRDWDSLFETAETRKLRTLRWVALPNTHDTRAYRRLLTKPDGLALYGAWAAILGVASRAERRGVLADGNGPFSAGDLALMTGGPENLIERAIQALLEPEIGWLSVVSTGDSPGTPGQSPEVPRKLQGDLLGHPEFSGPEGKGMEGNNSCASPGGGAGFVLSDSSKSETPKSNATWKADAFERFWICVWAKIGRGSAEQAFRKAAKTTCLAEKIIDAAREQGPRLLADAERQQRSPIHPATWLRGERWTDEQPSPRAGGDEYPELQP